MTSDKTQVTIFTKSFRVDGEIALIPGARLTDFMNHTKRFMVVTNATLADHTGKELLRGQFLDLAVRNIEVILPADSLS